MGRLATDGINWISAGRIIRFRATMTAGTAATNRAIPSIVDRQCADKPNKSNKLKARLPRGLADRGPAEIAATRRMVETIREVYERYGFEPVETPAIEYTDALGKFLPDQDRPNEGVFSFQDDDEQWLSLRYDLTAPLARYVAENFQRCAALSQLPLSAGCSATRSRARAASASSCSSTPTRSARASLAADAEMCMMAADTMEALGIPRGSTWSR